MNIGWLLPPIWLAGYLLSVLPIARALLRDVAGDDDQFDRVAAAALALVLALLWPIVLAAMYVARKLRTDPPPPDTEQETRTP